MPFKLRALNVKLHRFGAIVIAVPLLLVVVTGILLQLRKEIAWVQPPTQKGKGKDPTISMEQVLSAAKSVPEAGVSGWGDIDRVDVRPKDGAIVSGRRLPARPGAVNDEEMRNEDRQENRQEHRARSVGIGCRRNGGEHAGSRAEEAQHCHADDG